MMNDQDEMFERGTDTPAHLGCPQHMPTKLPGGFDGVEPAPDVEELKKRGEKLKACNDRSRARMLEISEIASHCVTETLHENGYQPGQYGEDYWRFGKAFSEIRRLVRESIYDVDPDYEMLALQFARNSFDFAKFQEALAAVASMKQVDFPGTYYTPGWLVELEKKISGSETIPPRDKPIDPAAPEMERGKGRLFKYKHISSCRGTYIYDRVVINGAHLRADLHYDNGGLEQHGSVYVGDSHRAFCFVTFNTSGATKCDYAMRGLLAGIAKRLVYHHKNLIKRKAKWAAAKAAKKASGEVK